MNGMSFGPPEFHWIASYEEKPKDWLDMFASKAESTYRRGVRDRTMSQLRMCEG